MNDVFLPKTFSGCDSSFSDAGLVIFGAPFDGTTTFRPGARFAPQAMRTESIGIETYSPYFDVDLTDFLIHDAGDLDLPFGNTKSALDMISVFADRVYSHGKKPVMLGGEHLATLPIAARAVKEYKDLCVIHFDAHTDLRSEYLGEELSHSTVMKRIWDIVGDGRIFQYGIRSGTREEFYWAGEGHTKLSRYDFSGLAEAVKEIGERPVYLTIDLDVLDPSVMPGTGTPEAGGVTFKELIWALRIIRPLNIIGADIVELSPHYDHSGVSTAVACKVVREVLICCQEFVNYF